MWMKPPYCGNRCLKGVSSIRKPSQCQVSRLFKDTIRLAWGQNWRPLQYGTLRTLGPLSIIMTIHCQCTIRATKSHGPPMLSSKILSWIAMAAKWRSTVKRTHFSLSFSLLIILPELFILLGIFIPMTAFKAYYLRRTFAQAIDTTEEDTDAIMEELQNLYLHQES